MSKFSTYGTYKVIPWAKDDIVASFSMSSLISHQRLPGGGESRLSGSMPLGSAARSGTAGPCWSSYSECNSGHMLDWNGGEGSGGQAFRIFNCRSAFVWFWWAARIQNHWATSFLGIGLANSRSRSCLRWKEEWLKGKGASRPYPSLRPRPVPPAIKGGCLCPQQ